MIRVVLDANVFVSAVLYPNSKPARIIRLAKEKKIQLALSRAILDEIERVLLYPHLQRRHTHSPEEIKESVKIWKDLSYMTKGLVEVDVIKDDPTDNKYIECAIEGSADFIISGDNHLVSLKYFRGIEIVTPDVFLQGFESTTGH
ncbi:MAG: putative toxin-antitoxin system toxin component, PIN family [Nitrospirae bacterium]|nr:putative toxin-antitoxin system toxin component, PIN family [Nitrospirota bacterium]MBF0590906.1 putative toxin-antitoxin system toxin component, PIN family [Nitrospirota bacterium]